MKNVGKDSNLTLYSPGYEAELDMEAEKVILLTGWGPSGYYEHPKSVRGLAERLSRVNSPKDILRFVEEYGPLAATEIKRGTWVRLRYSADLPSQGPEEEPFDLWYESATMLRRSLQIYRSLKQAQTNPAYDWESHLLDVIHLKHPTMFEISVNWDSTFGEAKLVPVGHWEHLLEVVWTDSGEKTGYIYDFDNTPSLKNIAAKILAHEVSSRLWNGIHLSYGDFVQAKDALLGYRIMESRFTFSPLIAAYYDLWELITEERPVIACGYCGRIIEKSGRRKYCNDACRQAAWRRRQRKREEGRAQK